jgi:phage-related baseplate assembly protein
MITTKTLNEVILNIINNIHDALPEADTKEGTWLRDIVIDPVSNEVADIYDDEYKIQIAQSVLTATGIDLERLASNYFITRKVGTKSSGKARFYIKGTNIDISQTAFPDIRVQKGTIITTKGTTANPAVQFKTMDDIFIKGTATSSITSSSFSNTTILTGVSALPRDATGYRYIEVLCEAITTGANTNIAPNQIVAQAGTSSAYISSVTNPFSFSGGSDPEDDISLALRISLAISGANIGTKDGYLSYILKQPQVLDAYVVSSGHPFMMRDIINIYNPSTGTSSGQHIGGKVDIYARTNATLEDTFTYKVTVADLDNDYKIPLHIKFPASSYPIISVESITGEIRNSSDSTTYRTYINANDYEIENNSDPSQVIFYKDILWDFSTKTSFLDEEYYPLPKNLSATEITRLKTKLDNELLIANEYLQNISYKIDWSLNKWTKPNVDSGTSFTTLFEYGQYTNNQFYKLKISSDTDDGQLLANRIFIKKEDNIYIRIFVTPDFRLIKDTSELQGSTLANDYITWINGSNVVNKPVVNEILTIKYIYSNGIADLQTGLEVKRVLTADVLVKTAKQKDVEIILSAICSPSYDSDNMKGLISDALSYYVNTQKKLGGYLDKSDIVHIVKSIDGIISVDLSSIELCFVNNSDTQTIQCNPNEYFFLKNLILEVTNSNTI